MLVAVLDMLRSLYEKDIALDSRDPLFSIVIGKTTVSFLPPEPSFWLQLAIVLSIQSVINALAGVAIYIFVVGKRGSALAYLVGYGVICPALVVFPYELARFLGLRNMSMLVGLTASSSLLVFRCLMAVHGTNWKFVERDMRNFVMFYVAPLQFNFDAKTGEALHSCREMLLKKAYKLFFALSVLPIVLGILIHYDYELFPRREVNTFLDLFYWTNLLNNYIMAYLTGICLETATLIVGFMIELISGKSVIELSDSPLTASTSPSDFWGRRWNSLVHIVLKGGVYLPLRKNGFSKAIAALATFGASGLLHEYVLSALAFKGILLKDYTAYRPRYGMHLYFFVWNGIVLTLESIFYDHKFIKWLKSTLPSPLITFLVIMTVLPIGHWFTDEYAQVGFYEDFAVGMPIMVWHTTQDQQ